MVFLFIKTKFQRETEQFRYINFECTLFYEILILSSNEIFIQSHLIISLVFRILFEI